MRKINMTNLTRSFHKIGFKVKKYSPEILVAAGVVGTVTSAVMACKATIKVNDILVDANEQLEPIREAEEKLENGEKPMCKDGSQYTKEDNKKDLAIVYVQTAVKFVKLYGPSVVLGAASLTCIIASHNILTKRNAALVAAYTAVDKGFKEYRSRVIERFGKDLDHELRYNIKAKEFEKITVDEKGKESTEKNTVNVADPNTYSEYARFFDDGCNGWSKDPEHNLWFLKCQQAQANDRLKLNGYLFLNDVYEMLGIPRTKAGQVVGWIYNEKNPVGDNFVDFGIYNMDIEKCRDFVNGYERTILLDFNVDGPILEMM